MSNFGFVTEEGSHGDSVTFVVNDFDDACIGHSGWDLARFIGSLYLLAYHCQSAVAGTFVSEKDQTGKVAIDDVLARQGAVEFLAAYIDTCQQCLDDPQRRYRRPQGYPKGHILAKRYAKAKARATNGALFYQSSTLAKAVDLTLLPLQFKHLPERFRPLTVEQWRDLSTAFAPYVDDHILAGVARLNAGTGSVNMGRYYLLVGPKNVTPEGVTLCHLVEVKQQRQAAPLFYFTDLSPVNQLNPAHLTVNCQQRMQRKPDLVLDDVFWQEHHWLVRSRHHAKVNIKPEHIGIGDKAVNGGLLQYAKACGEALALAHCRGDRRSTLFEQAVVAVLPGQCEALITQCYRYAQQVRQDTSLLNEALNLNTTLKNQEKLR